MKTTKITYYVSTVLVSLLMALSVYSYFTDPKIKETFEHLGFPDYFRIELAYAKAIGVVLLWIPIRQVRDLAYIGFGITFVSAFIAHISTGDPIGMAIFPLIVLAVLLVSYLSFRKVESAGELDADV
ncbi:MAG TPA: DoxX family protein [Chitinophagales bacterium]